MDVAYVQCHLKTTDAQLLSVRASSIKMYCATGGNGLAKGHNLPGMLRNIRLFQEGRFGLDDLLR